MILPFYNSYDYIQNAIESWASQTLCEKELICVDDGSTDGSVELVCEYGRRYANIHLVQMGENGGAGAARQKGISEAKGEYIAFLDSDDLFGAANALEKLYRYAKLEKCDVCGGFITEKTETAETPIPRFRDLFNDNLSEYKEIQEKIEDDFYFSAFIYKREYIRRKKIVFPNLRLYEDPPFLLRALNEARKIGVVNTELYIYRYKKHERKYTEAEISDLLQGLIMNLEYAEANGLASVILKMAKRINSNYLDLIVDGIRSSDIAMMDSITKIYMFFRERNIDFYPFEYFLYIDRLEEKLTDFKVYQRCKHLFDNKKEIILYGAGNIGKRIYSNIVTSEMGIIKGWIDHYKVGEMVEGVVLQDIGDIGMISEYDMILIGIDNRKISGEVKSLLLSNGVDEMKIKEWVNI